jgi:2,4-dienoyl-CoA reductase-like NADH-dependent reductase (Old Yellow Enzyme family)
VSTTPRQHWEHAPATLEELAAMAGRLGVRIDASADVSCLANPVSMPGHTIPNSLAIHPMEGCDADADGRPGPLTVRRYERFARGGAGLIWLEAAAVAPEGRANARQLWLHEGSVDSFAQLVERIHRVAAEFEPAHRPYLVLQITHSGRHSRPQPVFVHDDGKAAGPLLSDEELDRLQDQFVAAARLARQVGFDAVDVKACHNYLISDLLAAHTRPGRYGGSFENRTRFLREVVGRIATEAAGALAVATRLGIYDGVAWPHGWGVASDVSLRPDLTEPCRLIGQLRQAGLGLINLTIADPYRLPHLGRPYDHAPDGATAAPEHPLVGVSRIIELVGQVQRAFGDLPIIGTGYSWLRTLLPHVAAAAKAAGKITLVGAGRLAFAYPYFAADILRTGRLDARKVCIACSACTRIMREGGQTGCAIRDRAVYGPGGSANRPAEGLAAGEYRRTT